MVFNYVSMQGVPLYVPAVIGDLALQSSNSVDITGGSISNITDLAVADGGTGSSTQAGARANLGATAIGNALFTAVNEAAARTAIGAMSTTTPEIITNANGTAYRWPNGLQICVVSYTTTSAVNWTGTAGSRIYEQNWTYPAAFNETPFLYVSGGTLSSISADVAYAVQRRTSSTATGTTLYAKEIRNPSSQTVSFTLQGYAIGTYAP